MVLGQRLGVGDVECGAPNRLLADGVDERVRVHHAAASDVDEHALRRQRRERRFVDEASCGVGQRRREHEVIGAGEGVVDGLGVEADDLVGRSALLGRVPHADGVHVEPLEAVHDGVPDGTQADDSDRRAAEFAGLIVPVLAVPLTPPALVEVAGERQHVAEDLLGDARGVDARGVRHRHPALAQRVHRQVAVAGVRAREQLQRFGGVEELLVDADAGHDRRVRHQFAFRFGCSGERDIAVWQPLAECCGVLVHRQSVRSPAEDDDVGHRLRLDAASRKRSATPAPTRRFTKGF